MPGCAHAHGGATGGIWGLSPWPLLCGVAQLPYSQPATGSCGMVRVFTDWHDAGEPEFCDMNPRTRHLMATIEAAYGAEGADQRSTVAPARGMAHRAVNVDWIYTACYRPVTNFFSI